ncbi:uncharacterized protein LOC141632366 [Silene latifolia]|uniref:uncharacterized protein LOC141632366 n=1 Tax=Silene latifolia TaxID=37657 RepID=UPI003D7727A2
MKIGVTRTYKICKEHVNGFENIGASLNDCKNFHRDVKYFIHEHDGQLFIEHFKEMTETRKGFYFDYDIDDDGSLRRAIWADNHHKRSVTFCGALIAREDYESFSLDEELETTEFDAIWAEIIEEHGLGANDRLVCEHVWYKGTVGDGTLQRLEDDVYAYTKFHSFKKEAIYSIDTYRTGGFTERDELEVNIVKDSSKGKNFEVAYSPANGMKTIPDDYVVKIWTKECLRFRIFNCNGEGTDNMEIIDGKQTAMSIMWSEVHQTVGLFRGEGVSDVERFSAIIRGFKDKLSPLGEVLNKIQQMEKILNCTATEVVTIFPPKNSKNKGSGKRMMSTKTKALALARKPKRKCKNCKRMTNHDKWNWPNPFSEHTPLCEGSSDQEEDEGEEEEELESEEE